MQNNTVASTKQEVTFCYSFLVDNHGRLLYLNEPAQSISKFFSTSIYNKYVWRVFSALSDQSPTELEWRAFLLGEINVLEVPSLDATTNQPLQFISHELNNQSGLRLFLISSLPNLNPNQASKQLNRTDTEISRLQKLYTESPLGIVLEINDARQLVRFNDRFCELLGYQRSELQLKTIDSITHPEDLYSHLPYYYELLKGKIEQCCFYKRFIRKNGTTMHGKIYMSRIVDETGKVRNIATLDDISEKVKSKTKIRRNLELMEKLVDKSPLGVVCFKPDGKMLTVNQKFCQIFGYTESELTGSYYFLMTHPDDRERETQIIQRIINLQSDTHINFDKKCIRKNGEEIYARMSLSFVKDVSSDKSYLLAMVKDITEGVATKRSLKENAKELERYRQSNQQLENFAYFASHDLREPLRTIVSFTSLLQKRYVEDLPDEAHEFMTYIINGTKRMNHLIEGLLEYSRIRTEELPRGQISMKELFDDITFGLQQRIKEKQVSINYHQLPATILGINTQIKQLFQNLISNAIKYSKKQVNPIIDITAKQRGSKWYFTIQDNGIGIEAEHYEKIFGLFGKLHAQNQFEGNGLGLAMCKSIVENHGGNIWVTSTKGEGTCLHFTLSGQ